MPVDKRTKIDLKTKIRDAGNMTSNQNEANTVIFGPFIGEFGWETMHWMGFVNHLCSTKYSNSRKIIISYPGRSVLYDPTAEFISLPDWFLELKPSARNYILDGWINGYPGISSTKYKWDFSFSLMKLINFKRPHKILDETPFNWSSMRDHAEKVLSQAILSLGISNFTLICPWKLTKVDDSYFGFNDGLPDRFLSQDTNIFRFPNPEIEWSKLKSTQKGKDFLFNLNSRNEQLITIFPRRRLIRREDKNWEVENYLKLIQSISNKYPELRIALCGEPGGAHFENSVPENCIDLINIDPEIRLDAHIAALEKSKIAIGSLSGAMFLPLMTKTPTLVFGFESEKSRFERDNLLNTELKYLISTNPTVEEVLTEIDHLLRK